ncbi:hypothetical protein HZY97_04145 [Sphingomonas sp. R-74633]|uniref:hypothetical protein n=1 Tax=Sphingomonas sp. R-74633 TaxID=2751188 RepID=UPI0015D41473|nr:hypothetical protein [Sphingomonas sp. R-74633]NYT39935.1 hypothetical protein [Sphingomonas sp. R-74633]
MKAALGFLAAAGALSLTVPAHAQPQDGEPQMKKNRDAEKLVAELMGCFVRSERPKAIDVIRFEPGSDAEGKAFMALFDNARMCVPRGKKINSPGISLRGALAEALYLKSFKVTGPAAGAAQLDWMKQPVHQAYSIAQCAAERDPDAADALVRTKWHSDEEVAAASAIMPALQACANGRKVNFDRVTLHGLIAEGLFRARGGLSASEGNS